jgi:hypothetical protein
MEVARYAREGRDVVLIGHAGHPEVEGTMGRFDSANGGRMHLIENVEQARKLEVRAPEKTRFRHADHAVGGRHRRHRERTARAFSDAREPAPRGHLLRNAESAGRGERAHRELRRAGRRRLDHQLQFQPPA